MGGLGFAERVTFFVTLLTAAQTRLTTCVCVCVLAVSKRSMQSILLLFVVNIWVILRFLAVSE